MDKEALVSSFSILLSALDETYGPVAVLMLTSSDLDTDTWNLVVSAAGFDAMPRAAAILEVASRMHELVATTQVENISRISVLKTQDAFVRSITSITEVDDGEYHVSGISLAGVEIARGLIFRSRSTQGQGALSRSLYSVVANELLSRGYDVIVEPRKRDLPDFLVGYVPDIIARGPTENLVIEVKGSPSIHGGDREKFEKVWDMVRKQPGWRFLLIYSTDLSPLFSSFFRTSRVRDVTARIDEAKRLDRAGHGEAAFILAWIATEGAMRISLEAKGVTGEQATVSDLLTRLALNGTISEPDSFELRELLQLRNALVHGNLSYGSIDSDKSRRSVLRLSALIADLLSSMGEPVTS